LIKKLCELSVGKKNPLSLEKKSSKFEKTKLSSFDSPRYSLLQRFLARMPDLKELKLGIPNRPAADLNMTCVVRDVMASGPPELGSELGLGTGAVELADYKMRPEQLIRLRKEFRDFAMETRFKTPVYPHPPGYPTWEARCADIIQIYSLTRLQAELDSLEEGRLT
jgi:hypothetical protein